MSRAQADDLERAPRGVHPLWLILPLVGLVAFLVLRLPAAMQPWACGVILCGAVFGPIAVHLTRHITAYRIERMRRQPARAATRRAGVYGKARGDELTIEEGADARLPPHTL